jgi:acetyl esterase
VTAPAPPWVDPEVPAAGAALRERGLIAPPLEQSPVDATREAYDRIGAFLCEGSEPLQREWLVEVPGPHGAIPCRVALPDGAEGPVPALVYFHGGGFTLGRAKHWDAMMRALVRRGGFAAVNVDYRLAPEHRFPVAFDEAVAVVRHFAADGTAHGIDGRRLATGGDSAGANLALAAACALRDAGGQSLQALLLYYGVFSADMGSGSWQRLGSGAFGLSASQMEWIWTQYLGEGGNRTDWRAAPLAASMHGLPPVFLHAAGLDPLQDDSEALRAKLAAAGVPATLTVHAGVPHGFIRSGPLLRAARAAVDAGAAEVGGVLGTLQRE